MANVIKKLYKRLLPRLLMPTILINGIFVKFVLYVISNITTFGKYYAFSIELAWQVMNKGRDLLWLLS